jgi:gentisate 1,2-dioxygenase
MNAPQKPLASPLAEAKLMTDDEYYPHLLPKNIRPAVWRMKDVRPKLAELLKDPLKRADRRFLSLVNEDTPADNAGVLPGLFCGIQGINPGEHILPHRHNSFALYHIIAGSGYSVVEGTRIDWELGDTFLCPPWAFHEHINNGSEVAVQYVIQDMVARAYERNLMWEEPAGHFGHMVQGAFRPHNPDYDK